MNSLSKKEVIQLIDSVIAEYKESDEYAKRCLLHLNDIMYITSDECLKQGILSVSYLNDATDIEIHITTDFLRNVIGSTYDFSILFDLFYGYEYIFVIDELGENWEKDRNIDGKIIINNLLSALSYFYQIKLNCKLDNCLLYETVFDSPEFTSDEVLNQNDIRDLDTYFNILKENIPFITNCDIYLNGYNRFMCTFFPLFLQCEKNNIKFHFEKSILFIRNEGDYLELLSLLGSYLIISANPLSMDYINVQCSNIDNKSVNYLKKVFNLLYKILKMNNRILSSKPDTYITMSFDYVGSSHIDVGQFYKRTMKWSGKYEDVLKFDTLDNFINSIW